MQLNDEVNCFRNRSFTFHLYITKGHRIYIRTNPGRLLRATWVCSYVYSNIPLFFPLPNEIRPKRRFPLRVRDSRCTARLNTKQQPGHLPSQRPHDLQPFFIPKNILRHPAMNRIPILGSNHRHPINGKILIDLIKSSTGSPAAAASPPLLRVFPPADCRQHKTPGREKKSAPPMRLHSEPESQKQNRPPLLLFPESD